MLSALVDPSLSGGLEGLALGALPWAGDAVGALPWAEGHLKKKKDSGKKIQALAIYWA